MIENTSLKIDGDINFKLVLFNQDFCAVFDKTNKILFCITQKKLLPFNNRCSFKDTSTMKVTGVDESEIWEYIDQSFFGSKLN